MSDNGTKPADIPRGKSSEEVLMALVAIRDREDGDVESDHKDADELLLGLLLDLGYQKIAEAWLDIYKWFS